jgi:phenylalanyl-tRNA synthetase alpha chain
MNNEQKEGTGTYGCLHPISLITSKIGEIFNELGFEIVGGPEMETEYYNFDSLNVPKDHPARDMWDTFWIKPSKDGVLLRTHTSPVQVRYMEKNKPPIRIVVPGKCYRHEATDATHEAEFYQVEALVVDKGINVGHLKGVLEEFFKKLFGEEIRTRLRPSYFPFVEPGFETDVTCFKCGGKGCNTCKNTGWIEMGGSGLVHPKVLQNVGLDTNEYSGFAFGFGIDRLAMLKYGVDDIRLFHSGDLRLTNQF